MVQDGISGSVEARGVVRRYGQGAAAVTALDGVDLTVMAGEFFTLLGPSGCGKTTLLRCIAGFETPTEGAILLGGEDITGQPPNRRPVNTVFQSYALFPHLTVARNVGFGLTMQGRPAREVSDAVARMLALVKLEALADRLPAALSGGQQQRVALARALAPAPQVLLLDEPLSALDLKLRKEMQVELKRLQTETGITFVFVTHDQEEALTMSDRIAVMSGGRILQIGTPREIYDSPVDRFVADFIGETNFLSATVRDGAVHLASGEALSLAANGHAGDVTVAVRPEQVRVGPDGPLAATVARAVYFGTDTALHLTLSDGSLLVARLQSSAPEASLPPGTTVRAAFLDGAARVLDH